MNFDYSITPQEMELRIAEYWSAEAKEKLHRALTYLPVGVSYFDSEYQKKKEAEVIAECNRELAKEIALYRDEVLERKNGGARRKAKREKQHNEAREFAIIQTIVTNMQAEEKRFALRGVEISRLGTFKRGTVVHRAEDFDDIVRAYASLDFAPVVKIGHLKANVPAFGVVENVRRFGDKLIADLTHLPRDIYRMIIFRSLDRVSCEMERDVTRDGKKYRKVLTAVSLLGTWIPVIPNLAPLHKKFAYAEVGDAVDEEMEKFIAEFARLEQVVQRYYATVIPFKKLSAGHWTKLDVHYSRALAYLADECERELEQMRQGNVTEEDLENLMQKYKQTMADQVKRYTA